MNRWAGLSAGVAGLLAVGLAALAAPPVIGLLALVIGGPVAFLSPEPQGRWARRVRRRRRLTSGIRLLAGYGVVLAASVAAAAGAVTHRMPVLTAALIGVLLVSHLLLSELAPVDPSGSTSDRSARSAFPMGWLRTVAPAVLAALTAGAVIVGTVTLAPSLISESGAFGWAVWLAVLAPLPLAIAAVLALRLPKSSRPQ